MLVEENRTGQLLGGLADQLSFAEAFKQVRLMVEENIVDAPGKATMDRQLDELVILLTIMKPVSQPLGQCA